MEKSNRKIPYACQEVTDEDIQQVCDVLRSKFLTQGPRIPEFEKRIAEYVGAKFGVAFNSATSALHASCLALGIGEGDTVWTSPNTFVASANCALYCGADVDFVDIEPTTFNISIQSLKLKLQSAERNGTLPKLLIVVHYGGLPADINSIHDLSEKYGFKVIEDASHAIGAEINGKKIGNLAGTDITIFSFHPVKIFTSGEGGVAVTSNATLNQSLMLKRSHGITSSPNLMKKRSPDEIWNYQQIDLGFNYRMTDIHAALGISQLARISDNLKKRRSIAGTYFEALKELPIRMQVQPTGHLSSFHLFSICLNLPKLQISQRDFYLAMRSLGIEVNIVYIPVHRQPYFERLGFEEGYCPIAESFHRQTISIPMYPSLTEDEQQYVIDAIQRTLNC